MLPSHLIFLALVFSHLRWVQSLYSAFLTLKLFWKLNEIIEVLTLGTNQRNPLNIEIGGIYFLELGLS